MDLQGVEQSKEEKIKVEEEEDKEVQTFTCENCSLNEQYDYFGNEPPFYRKLKLKEDAYIIENPFGPPKQGEIIILGVHCIKCRKCVCKDIKCCFYYDGSFCLSCANTNLETFPKAVQEKLKKILSG